MVKLEAILSYQENCDYLSSEISGSFDIEQQEVDIETRVTILNFDARLFEKGKDKTSTWINSEQTNRYEYERFLPFYNDELLLEAKVTFTHEEKTYDIKYNDINVYFFEDGEDRTQLNPDDNNHIVARNVSLDNHGMIGVKYLPHNSGYFIVEYNETKFFKQKAVEHHITLNKIPTELTIKPIGEDALPLFIHLEESVDLTASVRDAYGKPPKDGVITFASYGNTWKSDSEGGIVDDKRDFRIIGNPVMLENGETLYYEPPAFIMNEDKEEYPIAPMGDIVEGPVRYEHDWIYYVYDYETYTEELIIEVAPTVHYPDNIIIDLIPKFKMRKNYRNHEFIIGIINEEDIENTERIFEAGNNIEYYPLVMDGRGFIDIPEKYKQEGTYYIRIEDEEDGFEFKYTILPTGTIPVQHKKVYKKIQKTTIELSPSISSTVRVNTIPDLIIPDEYANDDLIISITKGTTTEDDIDIDSDMFYPLTQTISLPDEYIEQNVNYHVRVENNTTDSAFEFTYIITGVIYDNLSSSAGGFITYSPIQEYALEKEEKNIEYIGAFYNYENEKYGNSWKYYASHHGLTRISVLIPGQINIALRKNDATIADGWRMREDGLYEFGPEDRILAYATITDKDGNSIFNYDDDNEENTINETGALLLHHLKFKITGTKWNIENNTAQYTVYTYDGIPAFYDENAFYNDQGIDSDDGETNKIGTIFELKPFENKNGLGANEEFDSYYDYNNKEDIQHDKLGPGIYTIEAYIDVEGMGYPYYDSMVSEKAYFEIMGPHTGNTETPEEPDEPDEPEEPEPEEYPIVQINEVIKKHPIYKGNVDIEIEVSNFTNSAYVVTTLTKKGQIDARTVNVDNRIFTLNQNDLNGGEYTVTATCPISGSTDSKTFTIDKANVIEIKNESNMLTGFNQEIGIKITSDGDITGINPDLLLVGHQITYEAPLTNMNEIIPIQSELEKRYRAESNGRFEELIWVEDGKLVTNAYYLWNVRAWNGCAAIARGWEHGRQWEIRFTVFSHNTAIRSNASVFMLDSLPEYIAPGFGNTQNNQNAPFANETWIPINFIEFNSGGGIYGHHAGTSTKEQMASYHPEQTQGGALGVHNWDSNPAVYTIRYSDVLSTCADCGYDVNKFIRICPICGSERINTEHGNYFTVAQEHGNSFDYFDFSFDGFTEGPLYLLLWRYGRDVGGDLVKLYDIKYIYESFTRVNFAQYLGDNITLALSSTSTIEEGEYNYTIAYEGDENYNKLFPYTFDIKIQSGVTNGTFEQINSNTFRIHHKGYNAQFVLAVLQAKNSTKEIRIPVLSDIEGYFRINTDEIENWNSYIEFNLMKDPYGYRNNYDDSVLKLMRDTSLMEVYNDLVQYYEEHLWSFYNHYEPFQAQVADVYAFYNQFLENEKRILFTTYNGTTIHEGM